MFKQLALIALTATAFTSAGSASADVLLPNLFAERYCEMREMGADTQGSLEWAVSESMVSGDAVQVRINGRTVDADVVAANRAARNRCPQYF